VSAFTSGRFWLATLERALKTIAQTAVATIAAGPASGLLNLDWGAVASVSALAGVLSVLTSIASEPFGPGDSPALVDETPAP